MLSVTAGRLSDLVNESLKIAQNPNNVGTKLSRLSFAKEQLDELKRLVGENSELRLDGLDQVERDIERLEREFESAGYRQEAKGNAEGQVLEKEGKVDEAIEIYERLVESKVDTPFTYKRLAILYKKRKQKNDEIRILNAAICNIPSENSMRKWFSERLEKINGGGRVTS